MTIHRDVSSSVEVVPKLRPIIMEWKTTPNSRIRKVVISCVNEGLGGAIS